MEGKRRSEKNDFERDKTEVKREYRFGKGHNL